MTETKMIEGLKSGTLKITDQRGKEFEIEFEKGEHDETHELQIEISKDEVILFDLRLKTRLIETFSGDWETQSEYYHSCDGEVTYIEEFINGVEGFRNWTLLEKYLEARFTFND